ncbi:hypothetical protein [Peribacillus butanolivorans]
MYINGLTTLLHHAAHSSILGMPKPPAPAGSGLSATTVSVS